MEKAIFTAWAKAQYAKQAAKDKLASAKRSFLEEDGGSEGIIIAIILIIIAVALAIIFRDWIGGFVSKLFNNDSLKDTNFNPPVSTGNAAAEGAA